MMGLGPNITKKHRRTTAI